MPYDLNDPNLDFAGQAEILARALKRGQMLRGTEPANNSIYGGGVASGIGAALNRAAGVIDQRRAEEGQTALNNEQLRRYDEISRQINAPQEGVDYSNPDALVKENARRMELAGQMSKLPMAQKMSQDYLAKGAAFPETMAQLAYKSIDRGENAGLDRVLKQAMALAALNSAESRNRENNQTKVIIAGMPARSGGDDELDRQLKQARIDALKNPEGRPLTPAQEKSALQLGNDRTTLEMLRNTFKPEYAGNVTSVLQRKMGELAGGLAPQATQDQTRWWADQAMFDELPKRHEQFGATLTPGEKASWAAAAISPNMSPDKIKERLAVRAKIYDDSQKRQRASVEAGGRSTKQFDAAVGATAPAPAAAAPEKVPVREVKLKDGRTGVEYSDGSRGFK
jgi:hypothetical protein